MKEEGERDGKVEEGEEGEEEGEEGEEGGEGERGVGVKEIESILIQQWGLCLRFRKRGRGISFGFLFSSKTFFPMIEGEEREEGQGRENKQRNKQRNKQKKKKKQRKQKRQVRKSLANLIN